MGCLNTGQCLGSRRAHVLGRDVPLQVNKCLVIRPEVVSAMKEKKKKGWKRASDSLIPLLKIYPEVLIKMTSGRH